MLYERLCFDHGQRQGLGSTAHLCQMFQTLDEDDNFGGAEEHLPLSRWLSWFRRWPALDRSWHKKLAAYSFCIVRSGNDLRNSLGAPLAAQVSLQPTLPPQRPRRARRRRRQWPRLWRQSAQRSPAPHPMLPLART